MKLNKTEENKIGIWKADFVTIINGSTFSDNNSYVEKLNYLLDAYLKTAYRAGKSYAGSVTTLRKVQSSRQNGKKGGRPRTVNNSPTPTPPDKVE